MLRNLLWEYLNEFFFKWWLFNWIIYVISICIIYIWDFFLKIKNASKYYFKLYIRSNFFCMFIGLRWITRIFYDEIIEWKYRNNRKLIIFFIHHRWRNDSNKVYGNWVSLKLQFFQKCRDLLMNIASTALQLN